MANALFVGDTRHTGQTIPAHVNRARRGNRHPQSIKPRVVLALADINDAVVDVVLKGSECPLWRTITRKIPERLSTVE